MSTQADIGRQTKVIVAVVAVVLIGGGYLAYTWLQNHNTSNSSVRGITTDAKGTKTEESEQYRQVLNRYNQANAEQAESNGGSYMSVMSAQSVKPASSGSGQQQQPQQVNYYYQQPQQPQQVVTRNKEYDKQIAEQVKGLMSAWERSPTGWVSRAKTPLLRHLLMLNQSCQHLWPVLVARLQAINAEQMGPRVKKSPT